MNSTAILANLSSKNKTQLIEMVKELTSENESLKAIHKIMEDTNKRMEKIEREMNRSLQYNRRSSVEITGIPSDIQTNNLEKEVIKIFEAAEVSVHGKKT